MSKPNPGRERAQQALMRVASPSTPAPESDVVFDDVEDAAAAEALEILGDPRSEWIDLSEIQREFRGKG